MEPASRRDVIVIGAGISGLVTAWHLQKAGIDVAVLEAEDISGNRVFYTEATRLTIQGEPIGPESLRVWKRPEELRVLWFTAEGFAPYLEVQAAEAGHTHVGDHTTDLIRVVSRKKLLGLLPVLV